VNTSTDAADTAKKLTAQPEKTLACVIKLFLFSFKHLYTSLTFQGEHYKAKVDI
jgi:hypothetical protein